MDWTKRAVKVVVSTYTEGLTVPELVKQFYRYFGFELPSNGYPCHRIMLEAMRDIVIFDKGMVYDASTFSTLKKEKEQAAAALHMETTKLIVSHLLSSARGKITVAELRQKFVQLVGLELPRYDFATHRLMLETMPDILAFEGDYMYKVGEMRASFPISWLYTKPGQSRRR